MTEEGDVIDEILFREHRGTLEESLLTEKKFKSMREMFSHIRSHILNDSFVKARGDDLTVTVSEYQYDPRVDRDLYIVEIEGWGVVGFCYNERPPIKGMTSHPNFTLARV